MCVCVYIKSRKWAKGLKPMGKNVQNLNFWVWNIHVRCFLSLSLSFIYMYMQEDINRYFIPLSYHSMFAYDINCIVPCFFSLKLPVYNLNAELIGFSERLNPRYERKRKMKDDSKLLELGFVAFWIMTCSAFVFSDEIPARWPAPSISDPHIVGTSYLLLVMNG